MPENIRSCVSARIEREREEGRCQRNGTEELRGKIREVSGRKTREGGRDGKDEWHIEKAGDKRRGNWWRGA